MIGVTKEYIFDDLTDFNQETPYSSILDKLRLEDQRPVDTISWATYTNNINLNYGGGLLTGTSIGGASITDNKLDTTGGTFKYVDYSALLNADTQQIGCIKFKITPQYTGAPSGIRGLFTISKSHNSTINNIGIYHSGTDLHFFIKDSTDTTIFDISGVWSPIAGTSYEVEINYDITIGASRLFINGNIIASDLVSTGTRDTNISLLRVGSNAGATWASDYYFEDLIIFNTVQHTTSYTPGYNLPEAKYPTATQTISVKDVFKMDELYEVTAVLNEPANTRIRGFQRDGTGQAYWYNTVSSQIEPSDESIDQANTLAEYEQYLVGPYDPPATTQLVVLIKSDDGETTPEVTSITFRYSYTMPDYEINYCEIDQDIADIDGVDTEQITMRVELVNPSGKYNSVLMAGYVKEYTSVNKKLSFQLAQTSQMDPRAYYLFQWSTSAGFLKTLRKIIEVNQFGSTIIDLTDYTG